MRPWRLALWAIALIAIVAIGIGAIARLGGLSARGEPSGIERVIARWMRSAAIPRSARHAANPVAFSPEIWAESRSHFADHCATCHANDGSGLTDIGRNLYPKAPDMRLEATQALSDGELYWIIENGVRLTGMPAWGSGSGQDLDTWKLVHFIRHLAELTPDQLNEMEALNPRSAADLQEEKEDQQFLSGQTVETPAGRPHHHEKENQ